MPRKKPAEGSPEALTGAAIKELRCERNMTQEELATASGAAGAKVVDSWESGWRSRPLWRIVELADGLGVSCETLASRIARKIRDGK